MPKAPAPSPEEELNKYEPPSLYFTLPDNMDRKPIKMTYGLEMDLRRMLPDPNSATNLLLGDPTTQDYVIRRCLTDVNKMIHNWDDLVDEDEVDKLDSETREALLMWAGDHAIYFFAKRTMGLAKLGVRLEESLQSLLPAHILNGLKASASETQSAGPSESTKETSKTSTGDMPDEKSQTESA